MTTQITVDTVRAFVGARGWSLVRRVEGIAEIWRRVFEDGVQEVVLPDESASDFEVRFQELLDRLKGFGVETVQEISSGAMNLMNDHLSVRVSHFDVEDGTIPLSDGIDAVRSAKAILVAAACASVEKRRTFAGRLPSEAEAIVEQARLGQTSHGSYVVNVFCPVTVPTADADAKRASAIPGTLDSALTSLRELIDGDVFSLKLESAVRQGVSSNLCDALVALLGERRSRTVTLALSPATDARLIRLPSFSHSFGAQDAENLLRTSEFLREKYELREFTLFGYIKRLDRELDEHQGFVWIKTLLPDGSQKNVKVQLMNDEVYALAIQAHEERKLIRCTGNLMVQPRSAFLAEPKDFAMVDQRGLLSE